MMIDDTIRFTFVRLRPPARLILLDTLLPVAVDSMCAALKKYLHYVKPEPTRRRELEL